MVIFLPLPLIPASKQQQQPPRKKCSVQTPKTDWLSDWRADKSSYWAANRPYLSNQKRRRRGKKKQLWKLHKFHITATVEESVFGADGGTTAAQSSSVGFFSGLLLARWRRCIFSLHSGGNLGQMSQRRRRPPCSFWSPRCAGLAGLPSPRRGSPLSRTEATPALSSKSGTLFQRMSAPMFCRIYR